jgi:DNA-binding CsgD family transcriptional regulator
VDEVELFSELVSDIYDVALDTSLWKEVIGKTGRFVGGSSAVIVADDGTFDSDNAYYDSIPDSCFGELYFQKYVKLCPATIGYFPGDVGQPMATADLMPYQEFFQTRFYREWAKPQGIIDFVMVALDKSVSNPAFFGVFRHERDGVIDAEAVRRMRLVIPHIRRALLVSRLVELKEAEAATSADTLDGISAGICLVDEDGFIVHANMACHAIFDDGNVLSAIGGRVVARDSKSDKILRDLFSSAAGHGDDGMGFQRISLPLKAHDGTNYVAHVLPLTSGARRRAGAVYSATTALFVRKAELETPAPAEVIAQTFNLTRTELRVLLAIVEVGGVPEVAAVLGVAETTIKTHLARLFQKTGAGRQAELVRIVAGFSTPLAR